MKRIDDLKLNKKDKEKVEKWLFEWIKHFKELANGREGTVHRNNFEDMDIFFYTDCTDILDKHPEENHKETGLIRIRKRNVFLQLFLKYLLGEDIDVTIKCSHCGSDDMVIDSYGNGAFKYCPDCGMISANIHPGHYKEAMDDILAVIDGYKKIRRV